MSGWAAIGQTEAPLSYFTQQTDRRAAKTPPANTAPAPEMVVGVFGKYARIDPQSGEAKMRITLE